MKYPKIETEEQYWKEFKEWKKKLDKLKGRQVVSNPAKYLPEIKAILEEGVEREVISQEFYNEKMDKFYKEINYSQNLKGSIEQKKEHIKKKARELFKR